jgi:hypothetical protein
LRGQGECPQAELREGDIVTLHDDGLELAFQLLSRLAPPKATGVTFRAMPLNSQAAVPFPVILKLGPTPETLELVQKLKLSLLPYSQVHLVVVQCKINACPWVGLLCGYEFHRVAPKYECVHLSIVGFV